MMDYKEKIDEILERDKAEAVEAVKRLVRIRSVEEDPEEDAPYGQGVKDVLDEALILSSELGFKTGNLDNQVGWAEIGEGEEMVAVLGHLDVVPEAEGWAEDTPPYDPVIQDGRLYGRGTIDDKGPVVAAMYALKAVQEAGVPLKRRVRILFGCNEETGAADMKYYRAHGGEIPVMGFTPDGEYPLINGEKGILNEEYDIDYFQDGMSVKLRSFTGGVAGNVTPDSAKAVLTFENGVPTLPEADKISVRTYGKIAEIRASGTGAHGSMPERGDNAIVTLARYVRDLKILAPDVQAVMEMLAGPLGDCNGIGLGCALEDTVSGKFTNNMGIVKGTDRHLQIRLNYRYPVTFDVEDCRPVVHEVLESAGWKCTYSLHKPKLYIPEDSTLVQTLLGVYREQTGDMTPPKSIGGGTYAKAIPNTLAFGCVFPGDEVVEHLPNEYIELSRFYENEKILARAIVALANV